MRPLVFMAFLVGCQGPPVETCTAAVSPTMNTIIDVGFTATRAGSVAIEYKEAGESVLTTDTFAVDEDETVAKPLLGLHALADLSWRVMFDGEVGCEGIAATQNLPTGMPTININANAVAAQTDAPWMMLVVQGQKPGLFVVDRAGQIVWYLIENDAIAGWVDAHLSENGNVLYNSFDDRHIEDIGTIFETDIEGKLVRNVPTPGGHHVFNQLDDGTLVYLKTDVRSTFIESRNQSYDVVGDALVEIAPDGTTREVFNVWDYLEPRVTEAFDFGFYPGKKDWSHANSTTFSKERNSYLVSFSNLHTIAEIDRASGEPIRWFGDDGDGYTVTESSRRFENPHDPTWTGPDTFMVFGTPISRSAAIEYRIDDDARTLQEIWSWGLDGPQQPNHNAVFLGQARRFENGNTLVKWARTGHAQEVTADDQVVWDIQLGSGTYFGEIEPVSTFYWKAP